MGILKNLLFVSFLLMSPIYGVSQDNQGSSSEPRDETLRMADISEGALREAKHYVSKKKAVHTYRMKKLASKEIQDEGTSPAIPGNVSPLLDALRQQEGVQRASFDAATATITVVTAHETELPQHLTTE